MRACVFQQQRRLLETCLDRNGLSSRDEPRSLLLLSKSGSSILPNFFLGFRSARAPTFRFNRYNEWICCLTAGIESATFVTYHPSLRTNQTPFFAPLHCISLDETMTMATTTLFERREKNQLHSHHDIASLSSCSYSSRCETARRTRSVSPPRPLRYSTKLASNKRNIEFHTIFPDILDHETLIQGKNK